MFMVLQSLFVLQKISTIYLVKSKTFISIKTTIKYKEETWPSKTGTIIHFALRNLIKKMLRERFKSNCCLYLYMWHAWHAFLSMGWFEEKNQIITLEVLFKILEEYLWGGPFLLKLQALGMEALVKSISITVVSQELREKSNEEFLYRAILL